jgi:hypothetical protein
MKRRLHYSVAALVLVLVCVFVLGSNGCLGSPQEPADQLASVPDGAGEGIAVHGHWVIEVKNPDGTLVERREFENALVPGFGAPTLAKILSRTNSVGGWKITLYGVPVTQSPFLTETSTRTEGVLVESTYTRTYPYYFNNLTVSLSADTNGCVLSGTVTAAINGNIGRVKTHVIMLPSSQPPSSIYTGGVSTNDVTETTLASPISLTAGQLVTVTVTFSFS